MVDWLHIVEQLELLEICLSTPSHSAVREIALRARLNALPLCVVYGVRLIACDCLRFNFILRLFSHEYRCSLEVCFLHEKEAKYETDSQPNRCPVLANS